MMGCWATILSLALLSGCSSSKNSSDNPQSILPDLRKFERSGNADIEKKIDDLIEQMTIEEKIGQMTQINNSLIVTSADWQQRTRGRALSADGTSELLVRSGRECAR